MFCTSKCNFFAFHYIILLLHFTLFFLVLQNENVEICAYVFFFFFLSWTRAEYKTEVRFCFLFFFVTSTMHHHKPYVFVCTTQKHWNSLKRLFNCAEHEKKWGICCYWWVFLFGASTFQWWPIECDKPQLSYVNIRALQTIRQMNDSIVNIEWRRWERRRKNRSIEIFCHQYLHFNNRAINFKSKDLRVNCVQFFISSLCRKLFPNKKKRRVWFNNGPSIFFIIFMAT